MSEQIDPRLLLKQALVKERMMSFELSTIDDDFYKIIRNWMQNLGDDRTSMDIILNTLLQIRKNKIATLAVSLNTDPEIREKMSIEEKTYFDKIADATMEFKESVS
jgi:DNA replication initiation complex subunit (GINS family)